MKKIKFVGLLYLTLSSILFGFSGPEESDCSNDSTWICEGYCFLVGDLPTNLFQPVSATGATEQEAQDKSDCGPYQETGISCRKVEEN